MIAIGAASPRRGSVLRIRCIRSYVQHNECDFWRKFFEEQLLMYIYSCFITTFRCNFVTQMQLLDDVLNHHVYQE